MPRKARNVSKTGIYLIYINLADKINITKNEEDFKTALALLKKNADKTLTDIYSYTFNKDYIALIVKERTTKSISLMIQSFLSQYSLFYNNKYSTSGAICKDRFVSYPIEKTNLIVEIIAYIHNIAENKNHSSYIEYFENSPDLITEKKYILSLVSQSDFLELHTKSINIPRNYLRMNKSDIEEIIISTCKIKPSDIKNLDKAKQDEIFKVLREERHLKINEIEKAVGVSKNIITRYKKYESKTKPKEEIWLL